ncbi:MAG: hypothetical protein OXN17_13310 [Candidatus Poribacteria bacterium]|nr:hypothetical protein [Candidatus Poribacteria bacterium]MDE0504102.1 hypothetical protein [Candidatus Poribacteria bacterium]
MRYPIRGGISESNGLTTAFHAPPDIDGGIRFKVKPKNSADVNGEGIVTRRTADSSTANPANG